jgi:hypothetical protein
MFVKSFLTLKELRIVLSKLETSACSVLILTSEWMESVYWLMLKTV